MKLAKLSDNLVNQKVALIIQSQEGKKLVREDTLLTPSLIQRLKNFGMNVVYIKDENTDVELEEMFSTSQRTEIITQLKNIYQSIENGKYDDLAVGRLVRNEIIPLLTNKKVSIPLDQVIEKDILFHSLYVCLLATKMALLMSLEMNKVEAIGKAALLHEVGQLIMHKKRISGKFPEEITYDFLKGNGCSVLVYTTAKYHNEFLDEQGTFKLPVKNQNEMIRILSLCNYYEHLLREGKLLPHECFEKLQGLVNVKFDEGIFKAFTNSIYVYPVGLPVKLNNKKFGIVLKQNTNSPLRPIIKAEEKEYNLMEYLSLFIEDIAM